MDRLEQPAGEQTRQPARVAAVGLDPVAWPLPHHLRRHHLTIDPPLDERRCQTKAVGPPRNDSAPRARTQHPLDGPTSEGSVRSSNRQPGPPRRESTAREGPVQRLRVRVVHSATSVCGSTGLLRQPPWMRRDHSPPTTRHCSRGGYGSLLSNRPEIELNRLLSMVSS